MSELSQVQHSLLTMGIEELKTLLFGEVDENNKPYINSDGNLIEPLPKKKKHIELLNKELRIYLVANAKADTVAYKKNAYGIVHVHLLHGVRTWYYRYDGSKLDKRDANTEIVKIAETARHSLEEKHDFIVQEEWQRKESILSSILGPRRALKLKKPKHFTHNGFRDVYTGIPTTTVAERERLKELGLEIGIFQELSK